MNNTKHTLGPWHCEPIAAHDFRAPEAGDFYIVSSDLTCPAIVWQHSDEGRANARLIAAAPELLEALEAIRDQEFMAQHSADTRMKDMADIARAAIAKVRA